MTVEELLEALNDLPGEMPIVVMDDGAPLTARWALVRPWKQDGWPQLEHPVESDDGDHEGFVPALVLSAEE